uniref:RRM domain-containing protein n=1 Tax=Ornithorhynchus anatinus TaxID=9258 RepID=F6SG47_ORNAN
AATPPLDKPLALISKVGRWMPPTPILTPPEQPQSEIKEHFSQFGHIRRCLLPFDKETGFHRGFCWVGFSSEEELQNALQHESHLIDGVKFLKSHGNKTLPGWLHLP